MRERWSTQITTLNAFGSVMSIATVVSGFRGEQRLWTRNRALYTAQPTSTRK